MPDIHDLPRPRASSALATAALGGLLCFTASCGDSSPATDAGADVSAPTDRGGTTDTGSATDTGAVTDSGSPTDTDSVADSGASTDSGNPTDTGAATDSGSPTDAGAATDVVAVADVSAPLDASVVADATTSLDASAADVAPFVCDVQADRSVTLTRPDASFTREEFDALCDRLGGFVEFHPHCGGANSCRGVSYDQTIGVYSEHGCQGLNTCTGYTCVLR